MQFVLEQNKESSLLTEPHRLVVRVVASRVASSSEGKEAPQLKRSLHGARWLEG